MTRSALGLMYTFPKHDFPRFIGLSQRYKGKVNDGFGMARICLYGIFSFIVQHVRFMLLHREQAIILQKVYATIENQTSFCTELQFA